MSVHDSSFRSYHRERAAHEHKLIVPGRDVCDLSHGNRFLQVLMEFQKDATGYDHFNFYTIKQ